MYLIVVHPRLAARQRPFPRSPRYRSRVNLPVLGPLTRGPQGQPSPVHTHHGRPGFQGIFPTSRGQVPHGWPTVPHSTATGFHSHGAAARRFLPNFPCPALFVTPRCPFPLCHLPSLALSPRLTPHPLSLPHRATSNPVARAHWILIRPGTVSCVLHGSLSSHPLVFVFFIFFYASRDAKGM